MTALNERYVLFTKERYEAAIEEMAGNTFHGGWLTERALGEPITEAPADLLVAPPVTLCVHCGQASDTQDPCHIDGISTGRLHEFAAPAAGGAVAVPADRPAPAAPQITDEMVERAGRAVASVSDDGGLYDSQPTVRARCNAQGRAALRAALGGPRPAAGEVQP